MHNNKIALALIADHATVFGETVTSVRWTGGTIRWRHCVDQSIGIYRPFHAALFYAAESTCRSDAAGVIHHVTFVVLFTN